MVFRVAPPLTCGCLTSLHKPIENTPENAYHIPILSSNKLLNVYKRDKKFSIHKNTFKVIYFPFQFYGGSAAPQDAQRSRL